MTGLGIKGSIDKGNGLVLSGYLTASNSDSKYDIPQVDDMSSMMSRNKDPYLSSTMGYMLGVPVISSRDLPVTIINAHLAFTDYHSSRELHFVGGHSRKELYQRQDFPGNNVFHAIDVGNLVTANNIPLTLEHSFAGGV